MYAYKKWGKLFFLTVLFCCCVACSSDIPPVLDSSGFEATSTQHMISVAEAEAIVKSNLPTRSYEFFVEYDHKTTVQERSCYRFRVYTKGAEPIIIDNVPVYTAGTYAWACVDVHTGELFELSTTHEELVPWSESD